MSRPLIAIPGGTSQLGRAIVCELLAGGHFQPIVLSRETSKTPQWLTELGVEVRRVNYLSEESCIAALRDVNTIISTLLCQDGTWARSQLNLLDAGLKGSVKRYVASEFGLGPATSADIDLFAAEQIVVREALQQAANNRDDFEWTAFYNGMFTNYLAYGSPVEGVAAMDHTLIFDVKAMTADLPVQDDGTVPDVTMTTIADVGKYVAAACTLPFGSWEEESYIAGQTLNMEEVIEIVEKVRGAQVTIRKHTKSSLKAQIDAIPADSTEPEHFLGRFFLQLSLAFADGKIKSSVMPAEMNAKFLEIRPVHVQEYVTKSWPTSV